MKENLNSSGMQFADSVHHAGENKVLFLVSALSVITEVAFCKDG